MTSLSSCSEVASVCHSAARRSGERRPRFARAGPGSALRRLRGWAVTAAPGGERCSLRSRRRPGGAASAAATSAPGRPQPPLPVPPVTAAAGRIGSREPASEREGAPAPAGHRERPLLGPGSAVGGTRASPPPSPPLPPAPLSPSAATAIATATSLETSPPRSRGSNAAGGVTAVITEAILPITGTFIRQAEKARARWQADTALATSPCPSPQSPRGRTTLTLHTRVSQELSLILPLGPAVPVIGVSTAAVFVFTTVPPGVYAAGPFPDGKYVTRHFTLVDPKFARSILHALPLLCERETKTIYQQPSKHSLLSGKTVKQSRELYLRIKHCLE